MRTHLTATVFVVILLAGCGGGGSSSNPNLPIPPSSPLSPTADSVQTQSEQAVTTTNSLGSPLKDFQTNNATINPLSLGRSVQSIQNGSCKDGIEFFAPDKNGDPNSTESQYFFDLTCTQLARDTVRVYSSLGTSSESVNRTESLYAVNNGTPIAVRTDSVTITNATFDSHGFPSVASGYNRVSTDSLGISGSKTINADDELVMLPASNGSNAFCGDSAGYNATGIAKLNKTFGWQGIESGTRTINTDGSITWTTAHAGNTESGAIGSLSIAGGTQNSACPIVKPMYTIAGGTDGNTYNIPVTATYNHGVLSNLSIVNAQLAGGATLNVTTNVGVGPANSGYITGTLAKNGTQTATFAVDAFGSGTLTITSSGAQFVITDWHVVR
ncbi:MAG: hypothetical protein NVS2B17_25820 [Candidatus Velthaea sp.]